MSEKITMFELLNERLTEEEIIKLTSSYDNKFSELERENILLNSIIKKVRAAINDESNRYYDDDGRFSIIDGNYIKEIIGDDIK